MENAILLSSPVEVTVKALVEFESELDMTKGEALDTKRKMIKDAEGLSEAAKSSAIAKAQQQAQETLAKARAEAESEADTIRKNGEVSLKSFEALIAKRKAKATEGVVARLLGETH